MRNQPRKNRSQQGFTIAELMVGLAIVGTLAAAGTTALTRDTLSSRFASAQRKLVQTLTAGRFRAAAQGEDFVLFMGASTIYSTYRRAAGTRTLSMVAHMPMPTGIEIAGVITRAALPGTVYTLPDSSSFPATLAVSGRGSLSAGVSGGAEQPRSATIFLRSENGDHKARIVVFAATGLVRVYPGW